jgi:hypothetical protein
LNSEVSRTARASSSNPGGQRAFKGNPANHERAPPHDGLRLVQDCKTHAQDVAGVIAALRLEALVPVWVVGTSMGTISSANAAARLRVGGPDGLVLTSSVTRRSVITRLGITVRDVGLDEITVPTLVVHHQSDGCVVSPFADAHMLMRQLRRAPKKEFMAFQGGAPVGDPCEAFSAHGFMGIDDEVVKAIPDWIKATR